MNDNYHPDYPPIEPKSLLARRHRVHRGWKKMRKVKIKLLKVDNHCTYCGKVVGAEDSNIDHRIPLSRGGTNASVNLVLSCIKCNTEKGNKTAAEFMHRVSAN